jgi:hypothetical protein
VVYANSTALTTTNVDVRIRFGIIEKATAENLDVEDQVDVILGPLEMLGLYTLLGKYLGKFRLETADGKAIGPEDVQPIGEIADASQE